VRTGAAKALVRVVACLLELSQAIGTRWLRAIGPRPVQGEALTVIAGLGFEFLDEPIGHLMIPLIAARPLTEANRVTRFLSGAISLCRLIT
jgi:hypothetical protein